MTTAERIKTRRTVLPMQRLKLADPGEDGRRRFEGYAAVFGNRDAHGDIIVKGAFARTLIERPDVKVLWQHDREKPIGLMESGLENDHGLVVRGVLSNTPLVNDTVVPLLQDGVVNGLSIGYEVAVEEHVEAMGAWLLKDIDLFEFSPVTFPANELATVTSVKSLDADCRRDERAQSVHSHAASLNHLLAGYFAKSDRREGLDWKQLRDLHALLGGTLPSDTSNEAAVADADLELAFLTGVELGKTL